MIKIRFLATIKLNEKGKEYYGDKVKFLESKIHTVKSIDLVYDMITVVDQLGDSVETVFPEYCETFKVEMISNN